jgi:hypothetical protein
VFLWVLKKFNFFAQNPWALAYGFTENSWFAVKTDRNSVFHGPDPHITDWLYIMVMYMSFYGFSKFSNFCSKSIGVSPQFY